MFSELQKTVVDSYWHGNSIASAFLFYRLSEESPELAGVDRYNGMAIRPVVRVQNTSQKSGNQ